MNQEYHNNLIIIKLRNKSSININIEDLVKKIQEQQNFILSQKDDIEILINEIGVKNREI